MKGPDPWTCRGLTRLAEQPAGERVGRAAARARDVLGRLGETVVVRDAGRESHTTVTRRPENARRTQPHTARGGGARRANPATPSHSYTDILDPAAAVLLLYEPRRGDTKPVTVHSLSIPFHCIATVRTLDTKPVTLLSIPFHCIITIRTSERYMTPVTFHSIPFHPIPFHSIALFL